MRDFTDDLRDLSQRLSETSGYLKVAELRTRLVELEAEMGRPDLWDDAEHARALNAEYANVRDDLATYDTLAGGLSDAEVLHDLAREVDDESQEAEIADAIASISARLDQLDLRSLFTGAHDEADAIVQINAKDGGVDAQDWSEMLLRMYERWSERRGFAISLNGVSEGTEAGIMSAEFTIAGRYAYGLMTAERGTHRLVRISPFDNQGRRQTSFAAVQVWPVIDAPNVELNDADIRMEVFRGLGRRWPARQQDVVGGAPDPRADRAGRQLAGGAQPAAEPGEGDGPPAGHGGGEGRGGAGRRARRASPAASRPRWAGGARSAATCCSPTRWSRTCAPRSSRATSPPCSTATSTSSWRATCAGAVARRRRTDAPDLPAGGAPARTVRTSWCSPVEPTGAMAPCRVSRDAAFATGLTMIRLENVTKSLRPDVVALRDASFDVNKGEFVFLVGPSGSGKSTLLRLLNRQDRPEAGAVWVAGRNIIDMPSGRVPQLRRNIGNVFQDYKLLSNKTVFENVAFAQEVIGKPKHVIRQQVPAVLDLVGLAGKEERFPHQLSGGEQQRVSVARAFVNRPLILLADEPTGNLDPATGEGIMRLLDRINQIGTTVLMATHDQRIVNSMRKRVIQLDRGVIVRDQARGVYD